MTRKLLFPVVIIVPLVLVGCGTSSPVVATIGNEKITLKEFEETYAKNNGGWDAAATSSLPDRQRFLDLLVKFRLKVHEAQDQGLLKDTAIQNELENYRLTVAQSYMLEKELVEPNVRRSYDRKREEVRASHILMRAAPNAAPAETLAAYQKAMHVIGLLEKMSFDTLARAYSEDPSASFNSGDLGYFSVGRMVPEFEDVCYTLKPGEYTKTPVRTQFGYHVVKLIDRQPNAGSVRVSHILLRFSPDQKDTAAVRDSSWNVYRQLKGGMAFDEAVRRYTQDPGSISRSGDIGQYERGVLPPNIRDVLFATPVDSVTEPIRFNYGYHIFKVTARQGIPAFAEIEKDLKDTYQQQRYQTDYRNYVRSLRTRYRLTVDSTVLGQLAVAFDSTKTPSNPEWIDTVSVAIQAQPLVFLGTGSWNVRQVLERINATAELKGTTLTPANVRMLVERAMDQLALEQHARTVGDRHPPFAALMQEYEDGVLLYRIEQDEVWKKIVVNDSLLKEYYLETRDKYRWPERVNVVEIYVMSDSAANACYRQVLNGGDFLTVAAENTVRPGFREKKGVWGLQPLSTNELTKRATTMAVDSISAPFRYQTGWSIIKVVEKDSAHTKTFEEASPEVASSYQDAASRKREGEWVAELKQKYPVVIHDNALSEAFKKKPSE